MTLRLVDVAAGTAAWRGEWAFADELIHLRSNTDRVLKEDLDRYLRNVVTGRSFLISGHRGTGKTTTVLRVVHDAYRAAIEGAIVLAESGGDLTPDHFQRPLLVKLHGPSLAGKWLPGPTGRAKAEDNAHAMLVQICIALYRAFAGELAACFARHARALTRSSTGSATIAQDRLELASQLALDLDQGCDPASLRACWDRLGRLSQGVLWPGTVGAALARAGYGDRGMQEVIAAATAGQAFQVCSGRVTYNEARRDAASRDSAVETGVRLDAKDVVNKLWGLAAGGLVGAALWPVSAAGAAIGGLGAGVIGSLAMSWTGKRGLRNERSTDYRFVIERSVATLDRELPVVIGRIRDCGLAPVFVIDELDKVDNGGEFIPDIINRLKNLITDFGFFCFLTDRDYCESVERIVRSSVFPKEASYFGKRLMVVFHPAAMGLHAYERTRVVAPTASIDALARWVLSCVMPYRAKCNMLDLVRELTGQGEMPLSGRVVLFPQYRWPMVLQLAIEHVLRTPRLRDRIGTEPGFLQLALDAMYIIPRAWEAGYEGVDLSVDNIRACLMDRMRIPGVNALERERLFSAMVDDVGLDLLHQGVTGLAELLQCFGAVRNAITAEADFGPNAAVSDEIVSFERERFFAIRDLFSDIAGLGLMQRETPGAAMWRFRLVPDGRQRPAEPPPVGSPVALPSPEPATPVSTPPPASGALPADVSAEIEAAVGEYRAFMAALQGQVEDVPTAVNLGLLPASFVPAQLDQIAAFLDLARQASLYYRELAQDLLVMQGVVDALRERRRAIAAILALAQKIVDDGQMFAPRAASLDGALRTIDALIGIRPAIASAAGNPQERLSMFRELRCPDSPLLNIVLPAAPSGPQPETWEDAIKEAYQRIVAGAPLDSRSATAAEHGWAVWAIWEHRLRAFLKPQASHRMPLVYAELVLHATFQFPSAAFDTSTVEQTSVRGWSMVCMHDFSQPQSAPIWALAGGLRALGFGARAIRTALALRGVAEADVSFLLDGAPPDRRGALTLYDEAPPEIANMAPIPPTPVFVVPWDDIESYRGILRWLLDNGLVEDEAIDDEADP